MFDRIHIAIGRGEERSVCAGFGFSFFCLIVKMRSGSCRGEEGTEEETRFFFAAAAVGGLEAAGESREGCKNNKIFLRHCTLLPFFPTRGKEGK